MPKMVCVKCEVELRVEKNGVIVAEMFQDNTKIYRLWDTDLWRCPICQYRVIAGFAQRPFAEHFEVDCESRVAELQAQGILIIYDKEFRGGTPDGV